MSEYIPIVLTARDALVADIGTPPEKQHFDVDPDVEGGNVEVRLGRSPLFTDLSERSRAMGQTLAPELKYLESRFRVALLTTSVSVLRLPGLRSVSALEYILDFDPNTEVAIIDLLPKAEVIDVATMHLGTDSRVTAEVNASGQIGLMLPTAEAGAAAKVSTKNTAGILANFKYTLHSVRTQAIGLYGKTAIWNIVSEDRPVVGDFIFAATVLVDQLAETIKFRVRLSASIARMGLFPEKRVSGWNSYQLNVR